MDDRPPSGFFETCQRDLGIIRQELVSILQETANVRATLTSFASSKPAVSRSFFVISGLCFIIIIFFMILYQQQLHLWLRAVRHIM